MGHVTVTTLKFTSFYISLGNSQRYFSIDPTTGKLYVTKEIDREALPITNGDIFNLQIEAKQKDNPLKSTIANVSLLTFFEWQKISENDFK